MADCRDPLLSKFVDPNKRLVVINHNLQDYVGDLMSAVLGW